MSYAGYDPNYDTGAEAACASCFLVSATNEERHALWAGLNAFAGLPDHWWRR